MSYNIQSRYLNAALDPKERKVLIAWVAEKCRAEGATKIVGTGVSGMLIGPGVADLIDVPFVVIRKPPDRNLTPHEGGSHSVYTYEGVLPVPSDRFVMVDDTVCTGQTVRRVLVQLDNEFKKHEATDAELVALVCYLPCADPWDGEQRTHGIRSYRPGRDIFPEEEQKLVVVFQQILCDSDKSSDDTSRGDIPF